jgi:hypothetical protein
MSDVKLGNPPGENAQRDAIHIAVAPVTSEESIYPGQHVGLVAGSTDKVQTLRGSQPEQAVGIADPFVSGRIEPGTRFWLLLYPQTITSLRHEWQHPAFATVIDPVAVSKAWLADIASRCGVSYDRMMNAIAEDDYIHMGENETYKDVIGDCSELQKHAEIVLGRKLEHAPYPFSCSC